MVYTFKSSKYDKNKASVFFFARTLAGRGLFIGFVFLLSLFFFSLFYLLPDPQVETGLTDRIIQFGGVFLVIGALVPMLYLYMLYGGHISAYFDDQEEITMEFMGESVLVGGKSYPIGSIRLYEKPDRVFLLCGGVKVYCILSKNCEDIKGLVAELKSGS
ncbi:MAG: hypothetical protein EA349_15000 [Halomonadaceae bacterium]|nr:MAG: hypothetical protein EA349_15000 [Halomonadaceae bacterium]